MGSSPTKKKTDLKPQTDASEEEQTDFGVTFSASAEDGHHVSGWWQTNSNPSQLGQCSCPLAHAETAPLGESGGSVQLEIFSTGETSFLIEVV